MKAAIVLTYGRPAPGRESKALEAFTDALTFFGKLATEDKCSEPMIYTGPSGRGMMIVHGDRRALLEIIDLEEFERHYLKAGFAVPDVAYELVAFGDRVQEVMQRWSSIGLEHGYM